MANKRHKQIHGYLTVKVRYIAMPGAEVRLAQAVDLLLKAAATNDTTALEGPDSEAKNLSAHDAEVNPEERIAKDEG